MTSGASACIADELLVFFAPHEWWSFYDNVAFDIEEFEVADNANLCW